jgi:hypothetical protein
MNSRAAFLEELSYRRRRTQGLQKFDVRFPNRKHSHPHTLIRYFFGSVYFQAQRVAPKCESLIELVSGNSYVIKFHESIALVFGLGPFAFDLLKQYS